MLFALTLTLSLCYLLLDIYHKNAEYKTDEPPHGYISWLNICMLLVHQDEVSKGEPLNRVELFAIRPEYPVGYFLYLRFEPSIHFK